MSIKFNVPLSDYIAMDALGSGTAHTAITQSPFHARHQQLGRSAGSKVADVGTVVHQLLLEGHENGIVYVDVPDWRTKVAKECRDAAYADGKTPLLACQREAIQAMVDSARTFVAQSEIAGIFDNGNPEVTVDWKEGGITCKARPDYLSDQWHLSLKTTNACTGPDTWIRRQLSPMGYDFSLAFYQRGLKANGVDVGHRILTIEQQPPYGCFLIALAPDKRAIAETMVDMAIKTWQRCIETNTFPCYSTETHFAEANPWEIADAEEREYEAMAGGAV